MKRRFDEPRKRGGEPRLIALFERRVADQEKICPRCKIMKSFSEYSKSKAETIGLSVYCKTCWAGINREYRLRTGKNKCADEMTGSSGKGRIAERKVYNWLTAEGIACELNDKILGPDIIIIANDNLFLIEVKALCYSGGKIFTSSVIGDRQSDDYIVYCLQSGDFVVREMGDHLTGVSSLHGSRKVKKWLSANEKKINVIPDSWRSK